MHFQQCFLDVLLGHVVQAQEIVLSVRWRTKLRFIELQSHPCQDQIAQTIRRVLDDG